MRTIKKIVALIILIGGFMANAQTISIVEIDGKSHEIPYNNKTFINKGVQLNNNKTLAYNNISKISTSDFDAYDKAMRKIRKEDFPDLVIEFTGDQSVYALQLEKLKKRRTGADVTRAAGGILTIIGVLSGDRGLTAAGIATNAAGRIARDVNDDKTNDAQTAMLLDLEKERKKNENKNKGGTEDEELRKYYGNENVDGLEALIVGNHEKALAFANVGELSDDANYRLSAIWLKALIAADQNNDQEAKKEYERLVTFDPEIKNIEEAQKETEYLLSEVDYYRKE